MSKLQVETTIINVYDPFVVTVRGTSTMLSFEQISIMSSLVYVMDHVTDLVGCLDSPPKDFILEGDTMIYDGKFRMYGIHMAVSWKGDVINYDDTNDSAKDDRDNLHFSFRVHREGKDVTLTTIRDQAECYGGLQVIARCQNGLLHSIKGQPAIESRGSKSLMKLWFDQGICYRTDDPTLPSKVTVWFKEEDDKLPSPPMIKEYHEYHNAKGQLHREIADGPACYEFYEDQIADNLSSPQYVVNGIEIESEEDIRARTSTMQMWINFIPAISGVPGFSSMPTPGM
jgi:hypothetical protein